MSFHLLLFFFQTQGPSHSHRTECAGRYGLVEGFDHGILVGCVDSAWAVALAEPEDGFYNRELCSSGIETCPHG